MYSSSGAALKYTTSQLLFGTPSRACISASLNCISSPSSGPHMLRSRFASSSPHIAVETMSMHRSSSSSGVLAAPGALSRIRILAPSSYFGSARRFSTSVDAESTSSISSNGAKPTTDASKGTGRRVVFMGTPEVSAKTLEQIVEASKANNFFDVVAAVTRPPAPAGRYNKQTKSPVHAYCDSHGIPVLIPEKASDPDFIDAMQKLAPDVCVTAAYGQYLPKAFLDIPRFGTVNIHPSLLPKYRGAAPVQRCLDNGDITTGVSVLFSVKKMDAGPLLGQETCELKGDEKASDLLVTLFDRGTRLLLKLLPNILSGCAATTTQDDSQATIAPKCTNAESEIHFESMSAAMVHNRCRALHGTQGVWTMLRSEPKELLKKDGSSSANTNTAEGNKNDKAAAAARYAEGENIRVKLIETVIIKEEEGITTASTPKDFSRGLDVDRSISIAKVNKQRVLKLTCGDGSKLGVVMLQPATKRVMSASDFMNGQVGRDVYWIPFESEGDASTSNNSTSATPSSDAQSNEKKDKKSQ